MVQKCMIMLFSLLPFFSFFSLSYTLGPFSRSFSIQISHISASIRIAYFLSFLFHNPWPILEIFFNLPSYKYMHITEWSHLRLSTPFSLRSWSLFSTHIFFLSLCYVMQYACFSIIHI